MIYIVVVSHGHDEYIKNMLLHLDVSCNEYLIIVRDNKGSALLKDICQNCYNVRYLTGGVYGFGHNNNSAVDYIINEYNVTEADYLLFLNPDILIEHKELMEYIGYVKSKKYNFSTLCLFRDNERKTHDYSVRKFPNIIDFFSSFVFGVNRTKINKESIHSDLVVDWCAGSFMFIKFYDFINVNGFDQKYFMYCEDIDLCHRLKLAGVPLNYIPQFHAIHYAHHDNRSLFSKAFRWHLKSMIRYLVRKNILSNKNFKNVSSVLNKKK